MTFVWLSIIAVSAIVSILLATTEAAFYLVKRRSLHKIADEGSQALERLSEYFEDPPSLLMPIHIGTYTAHCAMTVVLTVLLLDLLHQWAMLIALATMIIYLLFFRLTLPYAIARRGPERVLLTMIRPVHRYAVLLSPLTTLLRKRAEGLDVNDDDTMPRIGNGHGSKNGKNGKHGSKNGGAHPEIPSPPVLEENESRLVDSVARFSETVAREVMTPRLDIAAIKTAATVAEARKTFRDTQYSRLVAYNESLDDIAGVLQVRDVVSQDGSENDSIAPLVRPALVVPDGKRIVDLLREMQAKRLSIALLVDEYGVTAGLVSVEDILEELVGEIKDEYDTESEPLVASKDGSITAAARVSLDMLKEALDPGFEMPDDVETVGGLAMSLFGHVPKVGEKIEHEGYLIEILEASPKRVGRVLFVPAHASVASKS